MLRNTFLVSLLVYAVCAAHWQIREVNSAEDQDENICANDIQNKMCKICKTVTKKVKKHIVSDSTADEIKASLKKACEKVEPLNHLCKCFVKKYLHGLIEELKTDDGPNTICTKIHACKSEPPMKEFTVVHDQAHDNF